MNHYAFHQFSRKLISILVLIVLLFPASLGSPLGATPARAAPLIPFDSPYSIGASPMAPEAVTASLKNNSFESGNLTGWTVSSGNVEVLQSSNISSVPSHPISPTDGTRMALLCNGPGTINPAELDNLDGDLGPNNDNDRSILSQSFTVGAGEVPLVLGFDWNFLTSEAPTPGNFDDFFMVTLNSVNILNGSARTGGVSPFPDVTPLDGVVYTVNSTGSTNGCHFEDGQGGWRHFRYAITNPGTYTLSLLVSDQGNYDHLLDTGLLVDNFQLGQSAELSIHGSASPDPVVIAGEELLYTVTVDNLGPALASNVVLTATIPAGLVYLGSTGSCSEVTANILSCPLGDLAEGTSRTVVFKTLVPPDLVAGESDGTLSITGYASVSSPPLEINPNDNTISLASLVQDQADLRILKFGKPDGEVQAGHFLTYTIMVDNFGPSAAPTVTITDELRASGTFDIMGILPDATGAYDRHITCKIDAPTSSSPINPIFTDLPIGVPYVPGADPVAPSVNQRATITCVLDGALPVFGPSGGSGRIIVEVAVMAHEGVSIDNCADVSSAATDPDFSNNGACTEHEITEVADLGVTKTAVGEEQQVNQSGLIFNNAIPGQVFPTSPNYFASTRVTAGRRILYTLTVRNDGPSTAENVVLYDRLPAGVQIYQGSLTAPAGVSCETGTPGEPLDRLTCGLGTIATGGSKPVSFQVVVDSSVAAGTVLENDAYATSDLYDPVNGNNYANTQNTVLAAADMSVAKSSVGQVVTGYDAVLDQIIVQDVAGNVTAGNVLRYQVAVQNNGPSDAPAVVVKDTLPAAPLPGPVTFLRADGASCRPGAVNQNVLYCTLGAMEAGARRTFDLYVLVGPAVPDGTVLQNCAEVLYSPSNTSPPGPPQPVSGVPPELVLVWDPIVTNNQSCTNTTVNARADLVVEKTSTPVKVFAGEQVKYTLTVTNNGPSLAREIILIDTMPIGIPFETGPNVWFVSSDPDVVGWEVPDLPPGASLSFEIYGRVAPDASPGVKLTNTVEAQSATPDLNTSNNIASAFTFIEGLADLRITKFGKPDNVVHAGSPLTYTIVVDNFGPSYAHEVTILDQIVSSGGFQLLDLQSDRDAVCDPPGPYASLGITCVLSDTLEPAGVGNVGRWIVTAVVIANEPGSIDNLARVSGADFDPDLSNNSATVQHEISAVVDLQVTKTALGEVLVNGELLQWVEDWFYPYPVPGEIPILPIESWVDFGHILTYTLTVTNNGPSTAQNIVLKDYLPEGVAPPGLPPTSTLPLDYQVQQIIPSQGNCTWGVLGDDTKPLTCRLGSLPGGAAAHVQVVIYIPQDTPVGTTYYNQVQVYNDLFDPQNANDFDDLFTVVVPPIWLFYLPVIDFPTSGP